MVQLTFLNHLRSTAWIDQTNSELTWKIPELYFVQKTNWNEGVTCSHRARVTASENGSVEGLTWVLLPQCTLPKWLRGSRLVREQFAWWQVGTWAQRIAFSVVWSHAYGDREIRLSYLQTDGGGIQLTTRCFLTQCPVETCQVIGLGFMSLSSPKTPIQGYLAWLSAGEKGCPFLCLSPVLALKLLHLWISDHTFLYWASCSILGKVSTVRPLVGTGMTTAEGIPLFAIWLFDL